MASGLGVIDESTGTRAGSSRLGEVRDMPTSEGTLTGGQYVCIGISGSPCHSPVKEFLLRLRDVLRDTFQRLFGPFFESDKISQEESESFFEDLNEFLCACEDDQQDFQDGSYKDLSNARGALKVLEDLFKGTIQPDTTLTLHNALVKTAIFLTNTGHVSWKTMRSRVKVFCELCRVRSDSNVYRFPSLEAFLDHLLRGLEKGTQSKVKDILRMHNRLQES